MFCVSTILFLNVSLSVDIGQHLRKFRHELNDFIDLKIQDKCAIAHGRSDLRTEVVVFLPCRHAAANAHTGGTNVLVRANATGAAGCSSSCSSCCWLQSPNVWGTLPAASAALYVRTAGGAKLCHSAAFATEMSGVTQIPSIPGAGNRMMLYDVPLMPMLENHCVALPITVWL